MGEPHEYTPLEENALEEWAKAQAEIDTLHARLECAETEGACKLLLALSWSTGHGDSLEQVIEEARWQLKEITDKMDALRAERDDLKVKWREFRDALSSAEAERDAREAKIVEAVRLTTAQSLRAEKAETERDNFENNWLQAVEERNEAEAERDRLREELSVAGMFDYERAERAEALLAEAEDVVRWCKIELESKDLGVDSGVAFCLSKARTVLARIREARK